MGKGSHLPQMSPADRLIRAVAGLDPEGDRSIGIIDILAGALFITQLAIINESKAS